MLKRFSVSLLAVMMVAAPAAGQDAKSIIDQMHARQLERWKSVDNYTVTETVNGVEASLYYEKIVVDGQPSFLTLAARGSRDPEVAEARNDLAAHLKHTLSRPLDAETEFLHVLALADSTRVPTAELAEAHRGCLTSTKRWAASIRQSHTRAALSH